MRGLFICFTLLILSFSARSQQDADERLAREYSANGAIDKALAIYQKLYNNGAGFEYYDPYFSLLLQAKRLDEARKLASEMMVQDPASPVYKVDLGRVYQQEGLKEKTDSLYKALFRNLPADEFRIRELAAAFYRANAYDYAVTAFTYGRKVLGNNEAFAFDLLALYRYQKNREMLIDEYIHVLSFNPDPGIMRQAENTFSALLETDEDYSLLEKALQQALKKKAQQPALAKLLSWAYLQQEKFADALSLLISLDKRTGAEAQAIFDAGNALLEKGAFEESLQAFEYITSRGESGALFLASKSGALYSKTELLIKQGTTEENIAKLTQEYRSVISGIAEVEIKAQLLRKLADFHAYHLNRYTEATAFLEEAIGLPQLESGIKNKAKLDLGDLFLTTGEVWEATLLYSQVEKDAADLGLKHDARFRNARLSYFRGDFVWAQAQLTDLKGATNQMLANDALNLSLMISQHTQHTLDTLALRAYAKADMLVLTKRFNDAASVLDSMESVGRGNALADDMLMLRARIYLAQKNYGKAVEVLQQVADSHPAGLWADDALFQLGDTFELLKDLEKAIACYEKIITAYPGSLYISEARIRFRNLRGNSLG